MNTAVTFLLNLCLLLIGASGHAATRAGMAAGAHTGIHAAHPAVQTGAKAGISGDASLAGGEAVSAGTSWSFPGSDDDEEEDEASPGSFLPPGSPTGYTRSFPLYGPHEPVKACASFHRHLTYLGSERYIGIRSLRL